MYAQPKHTMTHHTAGMSLASDTTREGTPEQSYRLCTERLELTLEMTCDGSALRDLWRRAGFVVSAGAI